MKKAQSARACGHSVVVELLTQAEASGTDLLLTKEESQQALVKSIGPLLDKNAGIKLGDRVMLQGQYVPLPVKGEKGRTLGVVDLHNIKAVLLDD